MKYQRFTPQQEIEILRAYRKTGSLKVREDLILSYLPVVHYIAKQISQQREQETVTPDDLVGDGVEGLIYAIENFKIETGNQLNTYVFLCVRHAIQKSEFLRDTIRAPYRPRFDTPEIISIETPIDDTQTIADTLSIPSYVEAANMKMDMDAALATLSQQEVFILKNYYGLSGGTLSDQKIGDILGYSHTWIGKLRQKAIEKIKAFLL